LNELKGLYEEKFGNSWEDAKTEAGITVCEDQEDDFDDGDDIWELLHDDCDNIDTETVHPQEPELVEGGHQPRPDTTERKLEVFDDLLVLDSDVDDLIEGARGLSQSVFSQDCIERAETRDWTVAVLTEVAPNVERLFCGFICYVHYPAPTAELHIKLLAVSTEIKRRGHGTHLMRWLLAKAARMPESECRWLTVSAWESAMPFYERFGFCDFFCSRDPNLGNEEGDLENDEEKQFWMELKNQPDQP